MTTTQTTKTPAATTTVRVNFYEGTQSVECPAYLTVDQFEAFLVAVACDAPKGTYNKVDATVLAGGDEVGLRFDVQHPTCGLVPTLRSHCENAVKFYDSERGQEFRKTVGEKRATEALNAYGTVLAAL